ncbi:urea ABC transporter permease subunit UrtB [Tranquillimonas alkanivorans]|uniref:Amino acid/amide ABC transporter membrane protein 1, HAAT family n=1 Tax=Tranquillimonas alkanivorans TaxID=441119 RepID=A0A1I5RSR1_9RHOB|nr:urea ABC transporter permease subunit UrtB [Tranquillimonas alkanivorans]SFP61548.1 amino acid/amide ABC transporter membrane protein 1, HAAT family [Tranquillimonas alkanivorans]
MTRHLRPLLAALALLLAPLAAAAQTPGIQALLQENRDLIEESSRRSIGPAIDALADSGLPEAQTVMERWQDRDLYIRESDGRFFFAEETDDDAYTLTDVATGETAGEVPDDALIQLRPNGGIRKMIGAALVQFQLSDPDPATRRQALTAIGRDAEASHLAALRKSIDSEPDAVIRAAKERLERLLTIQFGESDEERVNAIESFRGDTDMDVRATLNPILATRRSVAPGDDAPADLNVARTLRPGGEALSEEEAYGLLVDEGLAQPRISRDDRRAALVANIDAGQVAGVRVSTLDTEAARDTAYAQLASLGLAEPTATEEEVRAALDAHTFFDSYFEPSVAVTQAAERALSSIELSVATNRTLDLALDALSLASIYFLAAIGLAITFGVMGVINMAHGEFIMMGAYTGYVVQQIVPDYTLSILIALPLAFAVTFAAGVAMERLVIRWLYHRPLETLLATFGISIALQQLAKNIFGTQARPLTSPDWLDGALVINDIVSISYIRIAIFVLALVFLAVFLFIMNRTRLGLEVRAVTQNPRMAASMGINPDRINMLTFGLGSGIAGIAGVAVGLYAKVTSELGQDYIVQSFMTVVVGGVGNIWGTLAGATLIGFLQKGIEWMNPSNTLAAQTYMILFIILFIQFRPRGIIALRGRAAGD